MTVLDRVSIAVTQLYDHDQSYFEKEEQISSYTSRLGFITEGSQGLEAGTEAEACWPTMS